MVIMVIWTPIFILLLHGKIIPILPDPFIISILMLQPVIFTILVFVTIRKIHICIFIIHHGDLLQEMMITDPTAAEFQRQFPGPVRQRILI